MFILHRAELCIQSRYRVSTQTQQTAPNDKRNACSGSTGTRG
jgi:hypothetical protein